MNESIVDKMVAGFATTCLQIRSHYIDIVDDVPDSGWSLASALAYIGLGVLAPIKAINPVGIDVEGIEQEKLSIL